MADLGKVREDLRDDLIAFGKVISPQTFKKKSPEFHYEIASVLQGDATYINDGKDGAVRYGSYRNRQICIEAPRGFAKSSIIAALKPLHHCAYEEGNKYVIIQSKSLSEAKKRLRKIKNIFLYSAEFRTLFGRWDESVAVTWNDTKVTLRSRNLYSNQVEEWTVEAKGTGQQIRGAKEDDQRITLLILDDPEDELNTKTLEGMRNNLDNLLAAIPGVDMDKGQVIVIGTPLHQLCIVETLMKMEGWASKRYKAVNEMTKTSLWEDYYSYEYIMEQKAGLASVHRVSKWYSEYQCEITGDEDQLFREEDIQYWDGHLEVNQFSECFLHITHLNKEELLEPKIIPVNTFIGIDPASSTSKKADYSVTMPVAYDTDENIYVLDYYEQQVRPTVHADQIFESFKTLKPKRCHVETIAYQEMLRDYLKNLCRKAGITIPGLELKFNPRKDKDERLEGLEPLVSGKKLHIKKTHETLLAELVLFPRGRKNLLDGLYYATRRLIKPDHTYSKQQTKSTKSFKRKYISWMAA